jgi:glycosyltransferase involved in cell wall biosynthesis
MQREASRAFYEAASLSGIIETWSTTMKLSYVTTYDASEERHWSGSGFFISRALQSQGFDLDLIQTPPPGAREKLRARAKRLINLPTGGRYLTRRNIPVAREYARYIQTRLAASKPDVVFSPGSIAISLLDCSQPIIFWTDATFAGMLGYYPEYLRLAPQSIREGNILEQEALDRCRFAIYASSWAARTALDHYRVDAAKIQVIPFGANLERVLSEQEVRDIIATRTREVCNLLFISVSWQRKGGHKVLQIAEELRTHGVPVQLSIVGEDPPIDVPSYAHAFGMLPKSSPQAVKKMEALYKSAHYLLLPSRAEAFGLVPAEANAFGVPALTSNTGGLADVVRSGANGQTFEPEASPAQYAEFIREYWEDRAAYNALALSSFREYRQRLNWEVAGQRVSSLIASCL